MSKLGKTIWRRAPASVLTLASLVISYTATWAFEDYALYMAVGPGGLGHPGIRAWLIHTLLLRPFSLAHGAATDPAFLPLDDEEWERVRRRHLRRQSKREGESTKHDLAELPSRSRSRPLVFGVAPQRQLQAVAKQGSDLQQAIIAYLDELANRLPLALEFALSTYEGSSAPCLFVRHLCREDHGVPGTDDHHDDAFAQPTPMARMYLHSTPGPKTDISGRIIPRDATKHELVHLHLSDGSLHLTLSPQDARRVIVRRWGELHRLAGVGYRGTYLPPYWLPTWMGFASRRWTYQKRQADAQARTGHNGRRASLATRLHLPPPTYTMVYAPRNAADVEWIKAIIECSVSWAIGRPL